MPIYKLEPIDDERVTERWEATSLGEVCWIDARSEEDARTTVEGETRRMVDRKPGQKMNVFSPWLDRAIVECVINDPGFVDEPGVIFLKNGKRFRH